MSLDAHNKSEHGCENGHGSLLRCPFAPVYLVVNVTEEVEVDRLLTEVLAEGLGIMQIRAKALKVDDYERVVSRAVELRSAISPFTKIIVNDSVEVCRVCKADGLHLGQDDTDPVEARSLLGPRVLIGLSTHTLEQVIKANQMVHTLDYIGFGPVFTSNTKTGHAEVTGLDMLREAVRISALPVVAIGGIRLDRFEDVMATRVAGVAVVGDILQAQSPALRIREYRLKYGC